MKTNTSATCIAHTIFRVEGDLLCSLSIYFSLYLALILSYEYQIYSIYSMDFSNIFGLFLYDKPNKSKLKDIFKCEEIVENESK